MSFFVKGDFKTREEWLKRQRKELMKKESIKFHEYNSKTNSSKSTVKYPFPEQKGTLSDILKTDDTELAKPADRFQQNPGRKLCQKDEELYQSMCSRLVQQEETSNRQRSQIKDMQSQARSIKSENAILRGVHQNAKELFLKKKQIQKENLILRQRFSEMEKYLNQQGAFWIEGRIQGQIDIGQIKSDIKQAKTQYRMPAHFQLETLTQRIQELNQSLLAEFGTKKFTMVSGVHRLTELQEISVKFHKNGVHFESVGFFEYRTKEGLSILGDLMDGYYPRILKSKYPEGVLMKVSNALEKEGGREVERAEEGANWFGGEGFSLD